MKGSQKTWLMAFFVISIAEIASIVAGIDSVHAIAKPLLMVSLALYFWSASEGLSSWRYLVLGALAFSWAGDVLLMADDLFVAGLASFLVAHVFFIVVYQRTGAAHGTLKAVDIIKFGIVGLGLMWILYPGLGALFVPVLVYAVVLLTMALWAHKRRGATSARSFAFVAIGAVLFVLSDAAIAVNRFAFDVPFEGLIVMSTYIGAQFMIVRGLLMHPRD